MDWPREPCDCRRRRPVVVCGKGSRKGLSSERPPLMATLARGAGMADIWLSVLLSLKGLSFSLRCGGCRVGALCRCCPCPPGSRPRVSPSIANKVKKSGWCWRLVFLSLLFSISVYLSRTTLSLPLIRSRLLTGMCDVTRDHQLAMLSLSEPVPFDSLERTKDGFRPCKVRSPRECGRLEGDSRMLGSEKA